MSKYTGFNMFVRQAQLYPLTSPFLPPIDKVEKDYSYANGSLVGTMEAGGPIGVAKTGQAISYRTGDDGDLELGLPATGARYTDNGDGTLTDNATGLMYINDFSQVGGSFYSGGVQTKMSWNDGIDACEALTFASKSDWHMANLFQLLKVFQANQDYPGFDPAFWSMLANDYYFSSTTVFGQTTKVYATFWTFRMTVANHLKSNVCYCMPVRIPT